MVEGITDTIVNSITAPQTEGTQPQAEPSGNDDFAKRLAILAKKEKGLLTREQEWKQKLKESEERSSKYKDYDELDKLLADNPLEYFKKKGLSFEELQQKMLSSLNDDDIDPIQKQLKELNAKLAAKDKEIEDLVNKKLQDKEELAKKENLDKQSNHYKQELGKFLTENKEEYELINAFNVSDDVFDVIKEVYLETSKKGAPRLMTFKEAADLYEKELVSKMEGVRGLNKVKKMFGITQDDDSINSTVSGITTFDDSFSQTSSTSTELKTEEERIRAAAKLFEQQMKSTN